MCLSDLYGNLFAFFFFRQKKPIYLYRTRLYMGIRSSYHRLTICITLACVFMFDSRLVHVSQLGLVY